MYVFAYAMQLLALLCALGGGGMALLLLFQRGLLPPPTPGLAAALPWLVTVLCAAAYAASWCIARKIYCKKEL